MNFEKNSEDIELPKEYYIENRSHYYDKIYPDEDDDEGKNKKKKIIIIILAGVLILGVFIFLAVYFGLKKKDEGGKIIVTHQIDPSDDSLTHDLTIINTNNYLKENDYSIQILDNTTETTVIRKLEIHQNIYNNEHSNGFTYGRIKFEIKLNKALTSMKGLFQNLNTLISVDLTEFNSEKITDMDSTFLNCINLIYVDFSKFHSRKLQIMDDCFRNCRGITEIDLSSFNTPKLSSMKNTFKDCKSLNLLNLKNFILNTVEKDGIFENDNLDNMNIIIDDENTKELLLGTRLNNTETYKCEEGDEDKCQKCEQNKCIKCNDGYYLYHFSSTEKCMKCFDFCALCDEYMNCKKCKDGYRLNEVKCEKEEKIITDNTDSIEISDIESTLQETQTLVSDNF